MFKLFATFLCAALGSAVLAQDIDIALPKANSNVTAGSDVIVKLDKPVTQPHLRSTFHLTIDDLLPYR